MSHPNPEAALLERRGDSWAIELSPRAFSVRDGHGMRYLAQLLARPGEEIHVLDLQLGQAGGAEDAEPEAVARATVVVRRAIRNAIRRVARLDPALGLHLERSVRTETLCCYRGSREEPIVWTIDRGDD